MTLYYNYSVISQLSFDTDLVISEQVESASAGIESLVLLLEFVGVDKVGGASVEGEEASIVGRLTGLFGGESSSSLTGADLLRTLSCK